MAARDRKAGHERRGGGGRMLFTLLLIGLVALAIAWFGNCVPGFGAGDGSAPADAPAKAETKADPAAAAVEALQLVVDGDRCRRGSGALGPCPKLCRALAGERKTQRVEIDGTLGTHAAVDALRKCLRAQQFRDVVVRAE